MARRQRPPRHVPQVSASSTMQDRSPLPSFDLDGRLAVITGASRGIGAALARGFRQAGARVVLAARSTDRLDALANETGIIGETVFSVGTDVTRSEDIERLADIVAGIARPNEQLVLVNNAGFGFTKPALETTQDDWDALFDTSARATFLVSRALAPMMIERRYGKIMNLSSTWSQSTESGKAIYSAAKAAVSRLTSALSTEWAPMGVRVNALAPTATLTEFTADVMRKNPQRAERMRERIRLGRFAETSDLLGPAIFLASAASDFVTGQTLFVDGGWNGASC